MTLEFLSNLTGLREYTGNVDDAIIRLYEFDKEQSRKFQQLIHQVIIQDKKELDLSKVEFIESLNCTLILRLADEDIGITTEDQKLFFCDLTIETFKKMTELIEPFCKENRKGYQWLYDLDTEIEFLFSPRGSW